MDDGQSALESVGVGRVGVARVGVEAHGERVGGGVAGERPPAAGSEGIAEGRVSTGGEVKHVVGAARGGLHVELGALEGDERP